MISVLFVLAPKPKLPNSSSVAQLSDRRQFCGNVVDVSVVICCFCWCFFMSQAHQSFQLQQLQHAGVSGVSRNNSKVMS